MSGFTAVSYETFNIGKRIKSSKKRYTWKILIDGKEYKIDMYLSRISGKINILINGDIRVKTKRDTEFDIRVPLTIANRSSQIVQIGNMEFDLKIGEGSFNTLYIVNNYSSKPNSSWPRSQSNFSEPRSNDVHQEFREIWNQRETETQNHFTKQNEVQTHNPRHFDRDSRSMSPQKTPVKEPLRDNPNISKLPVKKHEIDLLDLSFEPEKPEVNTSQSPMTVPEMIFNPTMPPNMQIPSYMTSQPMGAYNPMMAYNQMMTNMMMMQGQYAPQDPFGRL